MSSTVDAKKLQADESTNKKTDNSKYTLRLFPIRYLGKTTYFAFINDLDQ